jgi:chromosome segregation ATPase
MWLLSNQRESNVVSENEKRRRLFQGEKDVTGVNPVPDAQMISSDTQFIDDLLGSLKAKLLGKFQEREDRERKLLGKVQEQEDRERDLLGQLQEQNDRERDLLGQLQEQEDRERDLLGQLQEQEDLEIELLAELQEREDCERELLGKLQERSVEIYKLKQVLQRCTNCYATSDQC